jgi:hypothetical protein
MKRRTLFALAAAGLTLAPALAQQQGSSNAAVDYWRAAHWAAAASAGKEGRFSVDWNEVTATLDRNELPPSWESSRAFVSPHAIDSFIVGSRRDHCDFQIDLEAGPSTLLPHLQAVRSLCQQARFDARERLMSGEVDAAVERIAAIFRASAHVAGDGVLISSLVGASMAAQARAEAELVMSSGRLNPAGRDTLLRSLGNPDDPDPLNFLGALEGERTILLDWIRRTFNGDDAAARFAAEAAPLLATDQSQVPLIKAISVMDETRFRASLDKLADYYARLHAAWTSDAPISSLEALERRNNSGDFGPMSVLLGPALINVRKSAERAASQRAEFIQTLRDFTPQTPAPSRR